MALFELFSVALALSLDAFGISISIGLKDKLTINKKILFILSFGFFQFLLSAFGMLMGRAFNRYILVIPDVIGGVIVAIIGTLMIKEAISNKQESESIIMKKGIFIILGISVSIDALIIGFTVISKILSVYIGIIDTIFIGFISFIMSAIGFYIATHLKKIEIIERYSQYLAGIILILFGIKIMIFG